MRKMTPQQLKNSILQMAMQGKLVEQRPEEGTGEELYQQIQAEKKKLIKEGKIKKSKKLPPIEEDEISFEIPENWKWARLGEIGSWSSGATPKRTKEEYYKGDIPWLKTGDLNDGFINKTPEHVSIKALEETSLTLNPKESVLIAMYGATIGKLGILKVDATTNQACCACYPLRNLYNKYLFYFLMTNRENFKRMGAGGAQPNISKEKIVKTLCPLPPLPEQKRIVAKLEEIQPLLDRYEKAYNRLETYNQKFPENLKKSILQYAVEGKLVEQHPEEGTGEELYQQIQAEKKKLIKEGKIKKSKKLPEITEDEIPFEIPENWKWVRLDNLCKKRIKRGKSPKYVLKSSTLVFAQKCNTKAGKIDLTLAKYLNEDILPKYDESEFMRDNDIIINSTGEGTLGRVGIYRNKDNPTQLNIVPDSHVTIIRTFNELMSVNYLFYFLKYLQPNLEKMGSGSTKQTELSATNIKNICIPLSPLEEQKRIVAKIEELMPMVERCEEAEG